MSKIESEFQSDLIKEIKGKFPGCIVTKIEPVSYQGIPDLLILHKDKWATLECKRSSNARKRPNQDYYISKMNKMSFSRFVCPENKEEVLHDLEQAFKS